MRGWTRVCMKVMLVNWMSAALGQGSGRAIEKVELEELAWDFRFGSAASINPLVGALQRMTNKLLATKLLEPGDWSGASCEDECGQIERLRHWGIKNAGLLYSFCLVPEMH